MADCPYARCIQERRHIRRELLRWTKNMVFVVGLERVAEELMGRRKWKQYQDNLYSGSRSGETATSQQQLNQQQQPNRILAGNRPTTTPTTLTSNNGSNGTTATIGIGAGGATSVNALGIVTTVTALPTVPLKQESLQRHQQLTNHHDQPATKKDQPDDLRRLRLDVKLEEGAKESSEVTEDAARQPTELTNAENATSLVVHRRKRRRASVEGEGAEGGATSEEEEQAAAERTTPVPEPEREEPEKRLKLDESETKPNEEGENTKAASTESGQLRLESSDQPATNDTEGTKERTEEEVTSERIPMTQGLLRVKKEEELQEAPGCAGVVASSLLVNNAEINRRASPPPEDWKPPDKCYFCLDGKLPHDDQPPLSPQSESSSSSRSAESPMSVQVDPMAASVVAAALSGTYPTLLPQWCLPPRETPLVTVQVHQDNAASADQPLDLSAKPKNSQDNNISILEQQKIPLRMPTGMDPKSVFNVYRGKTQQQRLNAAGVVSTVGAGGGRRTYTEEELQAALRDIQSGKLGTRRAAVIYGIPRSTLRNKVYKLALERVRDASLPTHSHDNNTTTTTPHHHHHHPLNAAATTITTTTNNNVTTTTNATITVNNSNSAVSTNATTTATATAKTIQNSSNVTPPLQSDETDDKELSGAEEEKEVEKALLKPLLSLEDLVRFSNLEGGGSESLRSLLQRGQESGTEWPGLEHANIGPYIQKMLAVAAPFKGIETPDYRIPEVMRRLMSEDKRLNKNVNGDQSQHPHHHGHHQGSQLSSQTRAPMTNDDFNPSIEEEASDSGQGRPILKIPSYKPASSGSAAGCSNSKNNNGEPTPAAFAQGFSATSASSPGLLERASPAFSGTSSPTNSLVGKAVAVNFRDVIAKSISVKFQEGQTPQQQQQQNSSGVVAGGQGQQASLLSEPSPYKRGRYTPPQTNPASQQSKQQQQQQQQQGQDGKPKPATGGKGTRPKRGKYRNYDRDSLVEAVRAVQRGEMSVHRAGSYYGVPHSTLEYKVKERHLMRPRKRDQKQTDDKSKDTASGSASMRPNQADKNKPALKPQKPFASSAGAGGVHIPAPNGLKMPPFMESMPPLPFAPFNFWGPTPFMPAPFIPGGPNVPAAILPEQYFATQRMRGLQEQQRNAALAQHQQRDSSTPSIEASAGTSNNSTGRNSMTKTSREMAESLYDGSGANGSFLDNLIRSSLETGIPREQRALNETVGRTATGQSTQAPTQQQQKSLPETMSSKALIDQLCRNSRKTPLPRLAQDSSEDESYRAPGSARSIPDRPERVPTVDLSPSPSCRTDDTCSDRLASPPTPLSITRTGSRDDDSTRDSRIGGRETEVHNGAQQQEERGKQQLNHYPDVHNIYAVSTDKKSACDSKLIVDHSSQKTQQQQQKEFPSVGALVVRNFANSNNNSTGQQQTTSAEQRGTSTLMEDTVEQ